MKRFIGGLFLVLLLLSAAEAAQIKIAWDPNAENDLAGYKVYYGFASATYGPPIEVGNVTTYSLSNLSLGRTYFIAVTAYDQSNNESGYSNEVSGIASDSKLIFGMVAFQPMPIATYLFLPASKQVVRSNVRRDPARLTIRRPARSPQPAPGCSAAGATQP